MIRDDLVHCVRCKSPDIHSFAARECEAITAIRRHMDELTARMPVPMRIMLYLCIGAVMVSDWITEQLPRMGSRR